MSGIFEPWVGEQYHGCINGKRVLILGEAHYGDQGDETSDFTRFIIEKHGAKKGEHSIYAKIKILIVGGDLSDAQRKGFWKKVAFYNYIREAISHTRKRPTDDQWDAAAEPFLDTVKRLSPDIVIVLGKELGGHVPQLPQEITVCKLYHPSFPGFRYETEREKLPKSIRPR